MTMILSGLFAELSEMQTQARSNVSPVRQESINTNKSLRGAIWYHSGNIPAPMKVRRLAAIQGSNCVAVTGQSVSRVKERGKMGKRGRMIKAYSARQAMDENELIAMTMVEAAQNLFIRNQQQVNTNAVKTLATRLMDIVNGAV